MGAQAAALLSARGPVGDVPPDLPPLTGVRLEPPPHFDLATTCLSHGGVGLAPTAWDGRRLHLHLPGHVVVDAALRISSHDPPDVALLRRVLALDDDLEELWDACDRVPSLRWVRQRGGGRVLRSPTVWQDLVGTLAGTRASYRSTQQMVRSLVSDGPFPGPEQVQERDLARWGHRAPWLRGLARAITGGLDVERLLAPAVPDDEARDSVRALPGFGPFATAQLMPLLGRPRPLVLDGWLRDRLGDVGDRYAAMGRWAGTGAWLDATGRRLPSPA